MPLSRTQYDQIEDIYRSRRAEARREAEKKREAILKALPEYDALDQAQRTAALGAFKASVGGDEKHRSALMAQAQSLREKKEAMLMQAGFSPLDLQPRYLCPHCGDTGRREGRSCECFEALAAQVAGSDSLSSTGTDFSDFTLEWYDDREPLGAFGGQTARRAMEMNREAAQAYVGRFPEKKGNLFISGPVGTGKTLLCRAVAGALERQGFSVCLITAQEFFDAAELAAFGRGEGNPYMPEQIRKAQLLIIDDLGTEFTSHKLAQNALFTVINERQLKGLGTIISTNESLNEIEDHYLPRVSSRLAGDYEWLRFVGPDIRLMKKTAEKPGVPS